MKKIESTEQAPPLRTAVGQVDGLIAVIDARRALMEADRTATAASLTEAESASTADYLSGGDGNAQRILELRVKAEVITRAVAELERRRAVLLIDKRRAEGVDARTLAAEKRAELEKLRQQTGALLEQLSRLEGVNYTFCILSAQRIRTWSEQRTVNNVDIDHLAPCEVFPEPIGPEAGGYATPRSRLLRDEIVSLEIKATHIETELDPNRPTQPAPYIASEPEVSGTSVFRNPTATESEAVARDRREREAAEQRGGPGQQPAALVKSA